MKFIRKFGNSYYILLPKRQIEFFNWIDKPIIVSEITSDKIVINRLNIEVRPSALAKLKNSRDESL